MYKPLPSFLFIGQSKINGHGLFTKTALEKGQILGITHVKDERFDNGYIRTPLGGFFNHSEVPNCICYPDGDFLKLKTMRNIEVSEELTCFYWLYDI